jgi:hypothetical protein
VFSLPGRFSINSYFYFFSFMSVLIDSLILKTLNSVLDIELTYRVTRNLFKLVKNNLYRHFKFIEVAFSLPGRFSINSYFYFFSFMSVLIDSLILKTLNSVLDIELTYRVTRNLFKLVKNNLYRHFKFIEVAFSLPGRFSINSYFYFFSFMSVLIDSLILKTFNSVLDIDKQIL